MVYLKDINKILFKSVPITSSVAVLTLKIFNLLSPFCSHLNSNILSTSKLFNLISCLMFSSSKFQVPVLCSADVSSLIFLIQKSNWNLGYIVGYLMGLFLIVIPTHQLYHQWINRQSTVLRKNLKPSRCVDTMIKI